MLAVACPSISLWPPSVVVQQCTAQHFISYNQMLNCLGFFLQSKKRQYDQEIENLEKQQKQTIERLEQEHTNRLRDEAKRIKAEQEKELSKFQNMLKNKKKEVRDSDGNIPNNNYGHSKELRLDLPGALSTS